MSKTKKELVDVFTGVVLLDTEKSIFLVKEEDKNKIGKNRWNLPGGSIDGNEGLIEAAVRETEEETGYIAKVHSLLGCYKCKKDDSAWVYIVLEARVVRKKERIIDPEIKEGKWFKKNEFLLLTAEELVHPDMQLVYNVAISGEGLKTDSIKYIDYDVQ